MSIKVSFRKDRNKWQVDYMVDGKRHRPLFVEEKEANNFARRLGLGLAIEDQQSITIAEAGKIYYERESVKKSRSSECNDKRYINLLYHFMTSERGIERLKSIELADMEAFRDWLPVQKVLGDESMKWKNTTANRCINMMKRFFIRHIQWKHIAENPCQYLDMLESDADERPAMTSEQYLKALDSCEDWFKPVFQFIFLTGSPGSCIERLTWQYVDLAGRQFFWIRKKGGRVRKIPIPMTDQVFALLVMLRNASTDVEGPVFRDAKGHPLTSDRISREGNWAIKQAGIKGIVVYGMRHALASDMTTANVATEKVRQAMGHASITTTQKYANKIANKSIADVVQMVRGANLVAESENERRLKEAGVTG